MSTYFNADNTNSLEIRNIRKIKVNKDFTDSTKIENNQPTIQVNTNDTETLAVEDVNIDENFNLGVAEKYATQNNTVEDKIQILLNQQVSAANKPETVQPVIFEDEDFSSKPTTSNKVNNTAFSSEVNSLERNLPNWLVNEIKINLVNYEQGSEDYNNKFIEKALDTMESSGFLVNNRFESLGIKNLDLEQKYNNIQNKILQDTKPLADMAKAQNRLEAANANAANKTETVNKDFADNTVAEQNNTVTNTVAPTTYSASTASAEKPQTVEELNQALNAAEGEKATQQQALSDATSGSSEELQGLQANIDQNYQAYTEQLEKVDVDLAEQFKEIEANLNAKETEVTNNQQAITEQETTVSNSQTTYDNAVSHTSSLKDQKDLLENQKSNLSSSNMQPEQLASAQSQIGTQISNISGAILEAETAEKEALRDLNKQKEDLKKLNEEKEKLAGELDGIKRDKADFEAKLPAENQELNNAKTNYENSKAEYARVQANAVSGAQNGIEAAQNKINNIKTEIANLENNSIKYDYGVGAKTMYNSQVGEQLANAAHIVDGTGGWCLRGVTKTLNRAFGLQGENYTASRASAAADAADFLAGDKEGWEVFSQHFMEDTLATREDLDNLPAGAVVIWDRSVGPYGHISVSLGNGLESSDHIQSQAKWEGNFRVFYPVQ